MTVTERAKRNISLAVIMILTALTVGSFEVLCDPFSTDARELGGGTISALHICTDYVPGSSRKTDRNGGSDIEDPGVSDLSLQFLGTGGKPIDVAARAGNETFAGNFRLLLLLLCAAIYAYPVLKTHIRFIHRKDGSK